MEEDFQNQNYQIESLEQVNFKLNTFKSQEYSNQFYYQGFSPIFDKDSIEDSYESNSMNNDIEHYSVLQISPTSTALQTSHESKDQIDNQKKQKETKNLAAFFQRAICDHVLSQEGLPLGIKRKIQKKKSTSQKANIGSLKSILKNKLINNYARKYIKSFSFLDEILTANKLQDVCPPIKYCSKLLEAIEDPNSFFTWK